MNSVSHEHRSSTNAIDLIIVTKNLEKASHHTLQNQGQWQKKTANMNDEILRDRIVLGIRDDKMHERLLRLNDLTLQKAVDLIKAETD